MKHYNVFALAMALLAAGCGETGEGSAERVFPYPAEWEAPESLLPERGGVAPPEGVVWRTGEAESPAAIAQIAEWHETVYPDESFVITGTRFTQREGAAVGSDTTVWVWNPGANSMERALLWKVTPELILGTLPDGMERSLVAVWVENDAGIGEPVFFNRCRPQWIGPLGATAAPGAQRRIFGINMQLHEAAATPRVRLVEKQGEGRVHEVETGVVTPYSIEFAVPDLPLGSEFEVWAHNGHGGEFGWAGPLTLRIEEPWQRGDDEITLAPSGGDDTPEFQKAVDELGSKERGGTLTLSEGDFLLRSMINLPAMVRIRGAGMDTTKITIDHETPQHSGITFLDGPHIALEDLTLHVKKGNHPLYGIFNTKWQATNDHLRLLRIRWTSENGVASNMSVSGNFIEVTGVESWNRLAFMGVGHWVWDNTFYGQIYGHGIAGIMVPQIEESVFEQNHIETPDWPTGPDGNRNYSEFLERDDLMENYYWAKRIVSAGQHTNRNFFAFNTSKHVAADGNLAEMLLFHGLKGAWFGQVAAATEDSVTVAPSGTIDGSEVTLRDKTVASNPFAPEEIEPGLHSVVVTRGPGLGQARRIQSVEGNTLQLESPWRVPPTPESVIMITHLIEENILYENQLDAFPKGYWLRGWTANSPVSFWGCCWRNISDSNHSRGTNQASTIWSLDASPSYWNIFRNDVAKEVFTGGFIMHGENKETPIGASEVGNAVRDMVIEIVGHEPGIGSSRPFFLNHASPLSSTIFENSKGSGKTRLALDSGVSSFGLFRNLDLQLVPFEGEVRDHFARVVTDTQPTFVHSEENSLPLLVGNTVEGAEILWDGPESATPASIPLLRVMQVQWKPGEGRETVPSIVIPVANPGIQNVRLEPVTSQEGIKPVIVGDSELKPGEVREVEVRFEVDGAGPANQSNDPLLLHFGTAENAPAVSILGL